MQRSFLSRAAFSAVLSAGMVLSAMVGCHSAYQTGPILPTMPTRTLTPTPTLSSTPTLTPTYACAYTTMVLPGIYTNTTWLIYTNSTPTVTPTPVSSYGSRGVIRNTADWFSYCVLAGLDATTASPVDFSKQMILFRSRLSPECYTTTQVLGLDCRPDMLVMSVKSITDLSKTFLCGTSTGYFEGYVVDQDSRPVFWLDYSETTGSPVVIFYLSDNALLTPSQALR